MPSSREEVQAAVSGRLPYYEDLLAQFIRFNSVYGSEGPMQRRVRDEMERLGLDVDTVYCRNDENSINLAARINGSAPETHQSLVLNAHADIVPVDVPHFWKYPPLGGIVKDRVIYGRGAQDDKAGIAVILLVIETLKRLELALRGDLAVQIVIEEETSGNGTRCLLERGYRGDGVVICDGTWPGRLYHAHLGQISFKADITGDPMAASNERRAVNPIKLAMQFVERLQEKVLQLNGGAPAFEGIEAPYYVNVGAFHSGVWCGSVPAQAELDVQMGFPPPSSAGDMMAMVRETAYQTSKRIEIKPWLIEREPYLGDLNAPLIRTLRKIISRNAENDVQVVPITGYADMAFFGTENVALYGPGGGGNGHGVDEHYFLDHMGIVAVNLVQFCIDWCSCERP